MQLADGQEGPQGAGRGVARPPAGRPGGRPAGGAHRGGGAGLPQFHSERRGLLRGHGRHAGRGGADRPGRAARSSPGQPGVRQRQPQRSSARGPRPLCRLRRRPAPADGIQRRQGLHRVLHQRLRPADGPFRPQRGRPLRAVLRSRPAGPRRRLPGRVRQGRGGDHPGGSGRSLPGRADTGGERGRSRARGFAAAAQAAAPADAEDQDERARGRRGRLDEAPSDWPADPAVEEAVAFFRQRACALMLDEMRAELAAFGVVFDSWFSETTLHVGGALERVVERAARAGRGLSGGRRRLAADHLAGRRQGPGAHPRQRPAHLLRRRHRLPQEQARAGLRPPHQHLGRRPSRLRPPHEGGRRRSSPGGRARSRSSSGSS